MSDATTPKEYLTQVRGQYEILPYPPRDPKDERGNLFTTDAVSLDGLNHVGWEGARDLRKGARVLIAGQGTGDITAFMAEQLRDSDAEIVTIDLSTASIAISKERLAQRGLDNVTHHHLSILDLPGAGLGQFDIIECGGVLHHLDDPAAGLAALASALKDDGVMVVMVYAFYGRMAIYLMQVLMQYLTTEDMAPSVKIDIARAFLGAIPDTHWLAMTGDRFVEEIQERTGSGLYDLFLHSTDRAYTVPQVHEWVAEAGLNFGGFCGDFSGNAAYEPETYTGSPLLRAICADKPEHECQAIAELMSGTITKHHFYATKQVKTPAQFCDEMVIVPSFRQQLFTDFIASLQRELKVLPFGKQLERPVTTMHAPSLFVTKTTHAVALLGMLDGVRSIGEMVTHVAAESGATSEEVRADLELLYNELHSRQRVYLRHRTVAPYVQWADIKQRLESIPPLTAALRHAI